ncbi:MAG: TldD/PmbA family protein [Nannocystis sp.]|uniref:metallopeptidase TldD-related protein n=1 Tax=Nannocystis sp. TaxID=1962667 RepID=UPI002422AEEA|nr:metallopeptidase TldD-related protein [Nannocystis sp.]MBK9756148.1 TldD/PmbA family protein [Nannocystis sp.]
MTLGRSEAQALIKAALKAATLKDVSVRVSSSRSANLRFAGNAPTTSGQAERVEVSVTATREKASATVSGSAQDAAGVAALVARAEALAAIAPQDPEHMPPLGPQRYLKVAGEDPGTVKLGPDARTDAVARVLKVARDGKLVAAGLFEHVHRSMALGTSAGLFAYHGETEASLTTTMRTPDGSGSGWGGAMSHRAVDIDAAAVARRAADKAEMSRGGGPALAPGAYTVVLEAQAVADLLGFLIGSLGARAADEGRSFFSRPGGSAIGEALFGPQIRLHSDPADPRHPSTPIAGDGLPLEQTVWVDQGKLLAQSCSRFWAQKQGRAPLPGPRSLFMAGGNASVAELVRGVQSGVLITRLWYNRMLDPRQILVTGLTRDGTFRIEGGRLASPVKNMRYNESPAALLKQVLALGVPERVVEGGMLYVVPPLVVDGFRFASVSDAV